MMKIQQKSIRSGLLAVSLSILSVAGSIIGIWNTFNKWGLLIGIITISIIIILGYTAISPIIRKNERGVNFISALDEIGLVDIENRFHDPNHLPPEQYYLKAEKEIVITGISLLGTLKHHLNALKSALGKGVSIKFLLLSPDAESTLKILGNRETEDVKSEINSSLSIIKNSDLLNENGFEVKQYNFLLPFTGIMIDGNIAPIGKVVDDKKGIIRIQPSRIFCEQHEGIVFQFINNKRKNSGFSIYAEDFRKQWKNAQEIIYEK